MLQGSCPLWTAPDFVLERTKSGDVRKMPQSTHVTADIGCDVRGKRFIAHVLPEMNCTPKVGHKTNYYERV